MINSVVFFNHWHNGDLFISKEYVRILIDKLKLCGIDSFSYAHGNSYKLLSDLPAEYKHIFSTPVHMHQRFHLESDVLYVNTWVGVYTEFFSPGQCHSNFPTLAKIWNFIFNAISEIIGANLSNGKELTAIDGIPSIDWSKFQIRQAIDFSRQHKNIVLFCNTDPKSEQSKLNGIGLLDNVIESLAIKNPEITFVCARKNHLVMPNVFFTDDIFAGVVDGDLNEISFLSISSKMIVGRSGPWAYCHNKENSVRENCTIYTISDRRSDSLFDCMEYLNCSHYSFIGNSEQSIEQQIHSILNNEYVGLGKHAVFYNDRFENLTLDI